MQRRNLVSHDALRNCFDPARAVGALFLAPFRASARKQMSSTVVSGRGWSFFELNFLESARPNACRKSRSADLDKIYLHNDHNFRCHEAPVGINKNRVWKFYRYMFIAVVGTGMPSMLECCPTKCTDFYYSVRRCIVTFGNVLACWELCFVCLSRVLSSDKKKLWSFLKIKQLSLVERDLWPITELRFEEKRINPRVR